MSTIVKKCILPLVLFVSSSAFASRPGEGEMIFSIFGVVKDSVEEIKTDERDNKLNYGFGALVEANANSFLGIETGVIFVKRQYDYEAGGVSFVQEVNRLHIPVVAKFWPTNFLALGVGPYVGIKVGNVKNTLSIGSVSGSIDTNADNDVEFGLDATATLNFSIADKTGLFVEGRYSQPFDNKSDVDYDSLTGLVGVKLAM